MALTVVFMHLKYIQAFIALLMLTGTTFSALFGKNPETLKEISVTGSSIPELDLSRSSILTKNQVKDRQIDNLVDLSGLSPNLHINNNKIQSYGDIIAIRGIANSQLFGPAGVQLYVDDIPQADISSYTSTLYDVQNIEILRGPQGHKFGKSVTGGAINIKTQAPTDSHVSKLSASYGTFNTQRYSINSSGPLDTEGFLYSVALQRALSDGYINNTSGNANTSKTWHGSLRFSLDKGTGTKINFGTNFENHELGAQPLVLRDGGDFYSRSTDFDERTKIDRNQQFVKVNQDLTEWNLISITNRNDWSMDPNRVDLDLTKNTVPAQESVILQDQIEWSQEFRIESKEGSDIDWILGAFYSDSKIDGDATRSFGVTEQTTSCLKSRSLGIFLSISKNLTENDLLSLGLRYDSFEKKISRTKTGFNFLPPTFAPSPYTDQISKKNDFDSFSPSINWERKITDQLSANLRATYSEKPGGFSAYTITPSQIAFSEEETFSYEFGLLFAPSQSWGLNITGFVNDIKDYQFELPVAGSTNYYVDNADEVTAQGIEIEGFVKPSENFTFSLAYGLCNSEYEKFDGSGLTGKQLSFIPEHTLALSLNYEFDNGIHGQLGTKTIGDTHYWNYDGSNPTEKIHSYTLWDASLGYAWEDWEFSLFGSNLTDEEYYTSLVNNLTGSPGIAGSPRVIGLNISTQF